MPPLLCVGAREVFPAPQRIDGALEVFRRGPRDAQGRGRFAPELQGREGHELGANELIPALLRPPIGKV